ncbi:Fe2+ or Zn2+ uptake regulation protein [Pseudomonas fluvialis]|uniref:Fe2+ or Zn2+ uptake regulation protein n=1 Tax=Pseudomonas fluvialis TaxID=1793966 RepID=A0A7X0BTP3_9PSED|nr:hypothetical protein [Pseudomonas fluvialis]MBB6342373.1 Fe2+ or Zn2+ uptake regulation protein [Pseudomonas fluvialis]
MQMNSKERLKSLLNAAGLKSSLIRLKVLGALENESEGLSTSQLHIRLLLSGESLERANIRETIYRLMAHKVLTQSGNRRYRINTEWNSPPR